MSTSSYPQYKESRFPWLGAVPSHWELLPLKRVAQLVTERAEGKTFPVALENVEGWTGKFVQGEGDYSADGVRFCVGDLLLGKLRPYLAKAWLADTSGEAVGDFHVLRCREGMLPAYLQRFLLTQQVISLINGSSFGARMPRASWDFIGAVMAVRPPTEEQQAIAAFLDRETAKIDALVAEQGRLLVLLSEKRQAVISRAVTQGLDPSVPMKESGLEWLGRVPESWSVQAVWTMFNLGRGRVLSHEAIADVPGPYPVYSSQTENDGAMGSINTFDFDGDFLTWTTDGANAGTVFKRSGKFNCTNVCGTLEAKYQLNLDFFFHILNEATAFYVRQDINPKLMNGVMGRIRLPRPTWEEQGMIVSHCERSVGNFQALIDEVHCSIKFLKERRAALISAAVTGKIDVRGLVSLAEPAKEAA